MCSDIMKINKCKECKSKNMFITSDLEGHVFAATCLTCGWEFESPEFKKLFSEIKDKMDSFNRDDILKTKKKLI